MKHLLAMSGVISRSIAFISYATRDVAKNKIILLLIVTSLSIAYTAVFLSSSILAGFQQMLIDGAHGYLGDIVISPAADEASIPRVQSVIDAIKNIDNVTAISIRSEIAATITYDDKDVAGYRTVGVVPLDESRATGSDLRIIDGHWLNDSSPDEIVLGLTLADFLVGLDYDGELIKVGEPVTLNTAAGQKKDYTVAGIIDAKTFLPNLYTILAKDELESLRDPTKNAEIIVRLKDGSRIRETIRDIEDVTDGINAVGWQDEAGYVDDIVQAVTFIMGLINTLLTVSVFIIMSIVIFINVFQKRRQIGIMKSMGASNMFIVSIYVLEAAAYASCSYVIGFALYWAIHQYSLANPVPLLIGDFHTVFRLDIIGRSIFALLAAAFAGSIVPSYLASRTKIVNVIRETV